MKVTEVESALKIYGLGVDVRRTSELFPHKQVDANHVSVVCKSQEDQQRVHHWIQFMTPEFEDFNAWAAYVEAIVEKN